MKQRLGFVLVLALASASVGMSACSGDDTGDDDDTGGSAGAAGSHAGTKTGGTSSSGSSNKAGTDSGGQAGDGSGGTPEQGGAAGDGGAAGNGGVPGGGSGGADGGVGGVGDGGMAGTSGAGGDAGAGGGPPTVTYDCGSNTLPKKLCSAFRGANCADPTMCATCVTERTDERDSFYADFDTPCATCTDKFDAYFQCAVDAYESGNVTSGVECVEGYGADISFDNCVPLLDEANNCHTYLADHECPSTWPVN